MFFPSAVLARIRKHLTQLSLANHAPRESPVDPEVNAMCCLAWGKVCKLHEDSLLSTNSHSNGQTHTHTNGFITSTWDSNSVCY